MGVPRYLATVANDDLEHTLALADDLSAGPDGLGSVALVQCGRVSPIAKDLERLLTTAGRTVVNLVVSDRQQAQSYATLRKLRGVTCVWVFVDNLFEAFLTVFATQLAFELRSVAREGLPVIGVGSGALALGGLLVAQRVCDRARYDLVSGLGWAPRVLVDGGANRGIADSAIAREAARSLPGLLGVDVGIRGGVKVEGGHVESVGDEQIQLFGASDDGSLLTLSLDPGMSVRLAPPPFAPFTAALLPHYVVDTLQTVNVAGVMPREAPPTVIEPESPHGQLCPMCNKVHHIDPGVILSVAKDPHLVEVNA